MIEFGILTGKNIMSFGSGGFEIDLSAYQLSMMRGKSGHGKSTILEALTYCLFGKPYRSIKLAQLLNSINGKGLLTTVNFKSGPDHYRIVRGMKPSIFEIYKNDELIEEDAASRDYQKMLESDILGFGYKTFKQVCVIGSTAYTQFMSLSAAERRAIIEELLDINIFSQMSVFVKEELVNVKRDIEKTDSIVKSKNEELTRLNRLLDEMMESEKEKKESFVSRIADIETEKKTLNSKIDQYNAIVSQLIEKLAGSSEVKSELNEGQIQLRSYMEKIKTSKSVVKFFQETDHCSTCKQEITQEHKSSIFTEETGKIEATMDISKELCSTLEGLKTKIAEFDEFQSALSKANTKLTELQSSLKSADALLKTLNHELNRDNDSDKVIAQQKIVMDELNAKMNAKLQYLEDLDYANVCAGYLKDTGIRSKVIANYIPNINETINRNMEALDMFVNFELDENFNETIKSRYRDDFTYDSFSEGEKARIDASTLLCWREIARMKNSVATNLLIFDETCDRSLDPDCIDSFLEMIRAQEGTNALIITHRQVDLIYFDYTWHVEKKSDGFSRLEESD